MNNEIIQKCKRKLIELEEKIKQLNNQKSILLFISIEIDKNTNPKLNSLFYAIDLKDEISYLNDWIEFYSKRKERCISKLRKSEQTVGKGTLEEVKSEEIKERVEEFKAQKPLIKYGVPFIVLLLVITSLFWLKPSITGLVTLTKETAYSDKLSLKINESGSYTWTLGKAGKITSIKATGSVAGNGTVKIYIEKDGKRYLIFDNKQSK